jgi:hypothetical protein
MPTPPTPKQLRYVRALAARSGTTFTPPHSAGEASRAIDALKKRPASPAYERRADQLSVARQRGTTDGTAIRPDEVHGWGAGAQWAGRER